MCASSTTQQCVTISTSEAEYVATALFTELASETVNLFEDNRGAIAIAENQSAGGGRSTLMYVITLSGS